MDRFSLLFQTFFRFLEAGELSDLAEEEEKDDTGLKIAQKFDRFDREELDNLCSSLLSSSGRFN